MLHREGGFELKVKTCDSAIDSTKKGKDRRQGKRLALSFPIEVSGFDPRGLAYCEISVTTDVSEQGCCFNLLREVRCGDVVSIDLAPQTRSEETKTNPVRFQVMWVEASKWGWAVGAGKLQPDNMWHMAFPKQKQP